VAEVDAAYTLAVGLQGDISETLDAIAAASLDRGIRGGVPPVRDLVQQELTRGRADDSFPMAPARIVADIRTAMGDDDIVLCDTGAVKMWMARLYPTYRPHTCLVSNGLATMAFSIPGAFAAKLAFPARRVLAALGDGAFLMSTSEIETAVRERVHFTILVWVDGGYGLIGWKQDIQFGRQEAVSFGNPDFVALAESFGAKGYRIASAGELLPTLEKTLADEAVSIVAVPVDYAENAELIGRLGALTESI
jgi:acetolactate synthase I/II/III large subunit